jgi:hypothetical protein
MDIQEMQIRNMKLKYTKIQQLETNKELFNYLSKYGVFSAVREGLVKITDFKTTKEILEEFEEEEEKLQRKEFEEFKKALSSYLNHSDFQNFNTPTRFWIYTRDKDLLYEFEDDYETSFPQFPFYMSTVSLTIDNEEDWGNYKGQKIIMFPMYFEAVLEYTELSNYRQSEEDPFKCIIVFSTFSITELYKNENIHTSFWNEFCLDP